MCSCSQIDRSGDCGNSNIKEEESEKGEKG